MDSLADESPEQRAQRSGLDGFPASMTPEQIVEGTMQSWQFG